MKEILSKKNKIWYHYNNEVVIMQSRMERYHEQNREENKRTKKNEQLYQEIYENAEYSNIEGIATIEKPNEIDINQVKQMLQNRSSYQRGKEYRNIIKNTEEPPKEMVDLKHDNEKNYDIRDILNKAKVERKEEQKEYHSLKDTQYNILKNINIKKEPEKIEETDEELKELIHTITNTSMLNKLGDKELSLDLLEDLKSSNNTMVEELPSMKAILEENDNFLPEEDDDEKGMDKSFFTSKMNFKEEDFDDLIEMSTNIKKNTTLMKILVGILVILIAAAIIFVVINYVL